MKKLLILATCLCFNSLTALDHDLLDVEYYAVERWNEFDDLQYQCKKSKWVLYYQGRVDAYHDILEYIQGIHSHDGAYTE